nr:mastermind-like domain-containing protein 1 isoform X2 [Lytechinus pictus]
MCTVSLFPLSCYACIFKDTISLHGDELDDVFWDEKSEFGFLDDNDEEEDRDEEDGEIQEYHSESNLLHETTYIKNGHHHHHYQQNHHHQHHHYHTTQIDHNHYNQRRPTSPSVIPLRQNRLLQGKCYKEYRLSRSMPNLADEGHLVLSISNAQGLFQKAQQKVRGGRRISSRRYRRKT